MTTIAASVPTANGGRYVRQLCQHWSHKLDVACDGDIGTVRFPGAVATMAAGSDAIDLSITGEDREEVDRLKDVVAAHIDRFAFREAPLAYDWSWR
ncbi:DUF2218 domain-containing protein [Novosphingobium album (ex Liu et al. 2023)]|uniref:DUF2218 domain-containing protein n=1 Tax=Novosphingobium album (ex Liu et al. 2023) TaxID=3031130 RepID=A0ABT5WW40_9SPHN|nr:DUF2218 domain-containing protein [Novosphingobium album (ex Liu et al. 2023)]MDE8654130.1 DUF2218 domain-containing protein [Novosphingobium album (ex Liu et al. 2023)]